MNENFPGTFIFIGRSGCGKGTQVELLKKYIEENDTGKRPIFYLETGEKFRKFTSGDSYASRLSREISEKGELQPEFLAVSMWSEELLAKMTGGEHLIIDGSPRRLREAMILDTALSFFRRKSTVIVNIEVSKEWSRARLSGRKRGDDIGAEEVEKRLAWFDTDVRPAINWFRSEPAYRVVDINGEQTISEVHREIINKVFSL